MYSIAVLFVFFPFSLSAVTIRKCENTVATFLVILPVAFILLAIWIVKRALTHALIIFELSNICLSIWPQVGALALFLSSMERTVVETTIRPLEQPIAFHSVVDKGPLVDFTTACNASTIPVDLTLLKESFKHGVVRVYLEAHAVRFEAIDVDLTAILASTSPLLKLKLFLALSIKVVICFTLRIVVKWAQHLVDVSYRFVADAVHDIVVVLDSEVMLKANDVTIKAFPEVD